MTGYAFCSGRSFLEIFISFLINVRIQYAILNPSHNHTIMYSEQCFAKAHNPIPPPLTSFIKRHR